jgi:DNA-binding NarL/FixJ family response regulator
VSEAISLKSFGQMMHVYNLISIVCEYNLQEHSMTTVLIVEDDPLISISLRMVLEDEGYEICGVAATEEQAISLGLTHGPDVAIVDVRLAEGSGIVAGRSLLAGGTRIVFATAHAAEIAREFPDAEVPIIEKPYDAQLIVRTVGFLAGGEAYRMPSGILATDHRRAA